nr:cobalt-precorrin-6A reductase [Kibdelosporangium sp. MJ126-NF4]CEL23555.1 Cobalt-precorrin-6x reductase [Kibdelosporangium sp. MJ126-NF4]CTQ89169.1 Cobalt-precorrin-6x reductase (EC 1.3.1.54) [Kibdelosporangium sp. MJ126-NF4]
MNILILGGTAEARLLAGQLPEHKVVSSLAGRVRTPRLPPGEVRVGGFGGPDGLRAWLLDNETNAVIDATHPFAATMTVTASAVTRDLGLPLVVLRRPGWRESPGDDWRWVDSVAEAAASLPAERVFLTTGREELAEFAGLRNWFLARSVETPRPPVPQRLTVILDRGPFTVDGEIALMRQHRIQVLVTKDSGGDMTAAKLTAARELGLPVVVVRRPPLPDGVDTASTVAEAVSWVRDIAEA